MAHWPHRRHKAMPEIFSVRRAKRVDEHAAFQAQLYQQSGPLKVELDWLKKSWICPLRPHAACSSPIIRTSASPGSVPW
jgi:hypothetical protein